MKKHEQKAKKEHAQKETKKSNWGLWVGILIALVVIVVLILIFKGGKEVTPPVTAPTAPEQPVAPVEAPKPAETPKTMAPVEEAPAEIRYCDKLLALGYTPCSCNLKDGSLDITFKNSGKVDYSGMWFYAVGASGKATYLFDGNALKAGEAKKFTVDLSALGSKLGEPVKNLEAHPSVKQDGKDESCLNARLLAIKDSSCFDAAKCDFTTPGAQAVS